MTNRTLLIGAGLSLFVAGSGSIADEGQSKVDRAALLAQPERLPAQLQEWAFLLGEWEIATKRYTFEGEVGEEESGRTEFTISPTGAQILEHERTVLSDNDVAALHVFVVNPENGSIEIARTDSGHYTIGVLRGVISADRIELLEKHPNPEHSVIRRVVYERIEDDHFTRRLYFSTDQGETWFVRFEGVYTRAE